MKLATFVPSGHWQSRIGHVDVDLGRILDLNAAHSYYLVEEEGEKAATASDLANVLIPPEMLSFIGRGEAGLELARLMIERLADSTDNNALDREGKRVWHRMNEVDLKAPIPRPAGVGIGYFNAEGVIEEASRAGVEDEGITMTIEYPKEATISWSPASTVIGPEDSVVFPKISKAIFNSIELGIVIGQEAYQVPLEKAEDYILGYTVTSDITAFDLVQAENFVFTVTRCKSMPTFWPTGPWITTSDEIADPMDLSVQVRFNGKVKQRERTSSYIFSPVEYVRDVSKYMSLEPGVIIGMGGFQETTRETLPEVGDVIENEIEGIGVLRNHVVAER